MADQDLLPLPSSVPVDPDTEWSSSAATEIRGTLTWAPPRPQIVLTVVLLIELETKVHPKVHNHGEGPY